MGRTAGRERRADTVQTGVCGEEWALTPRAGEPSATATPTKEVLDRTASLENNELCFNLLFPKVLLHCLLTSFFFFFFAFIKDCWQMEVLAQN